MPGPMSIPNGNVAALVKVVEHVDGKKIERQVPMAQLTGEQRAYLASRHRLDTGKTAKKEKRVTERGDLHDAD